MDFKGSQHGVEERVSVPDEQELTVLERFTKVAEIVELIPQ
jgi:hypothetical protein